MKKCCLLLLFLSLMVNSFAGLEIWVKLGDNLWASYPDSKLTIAPSDHITIGIMDITGQTQPGPLALGLTEGPGSLDASGIVTFQGVTAEMKDDAAAAKDLGLQNLFIAMDVPATTTAGMLVSQVDFHCDGPWDVTIAVVDVDGQIMDTQVIHQVPEPMTIALLGLGGLGMIVRKRS